MATNRFVLVPEDVYKGFTSTDTGNINLDYSRRMLENVKKEKTNPNTKNARYNQELRRYLHLKKEHEDKPVKVEMSGAANIQTALPQKTAQKTTIKAPPTQATPISDITNEFMMRISANPDKYQVTAEGKIKNEHGKIIEGSNIKKSIGWIIANEKGLKAGGRPRGTMNIENIIKKDDVLTQMLKDIKPNIIPGTPTSSKKYFTPQRWT